MKILDYRNFDVCMLVKKEREKRFLTLEDVGSGVGVSANYIFRIEKGRVKPSDLTVEKLIKFFDLDESRLLLYKSMDRQNEIETHIIEEKEEETRSKEIMNVVDFESLRKKKKLEE